MYSRLIPVALAVFALGCGVRYQTPLSASPVGPGANEKVGVDHAVLILDSSGSLDREELFPAEKATFEAFVGAMPSGSYGTRIIVFGGDNRQKFVQKSFDRAGLKQQARYAHYFAQGTPIDTILGEVQEALEGARGRLAIALFSDGLQTPAHGGDVDIETVLAAATNLIDAHQGTTCIHTVQAGDDPAGSDMLRRLAALTDCGSYRSARSLGNVASVQSFERAVFMVAVPLPPVAAAPRSFASILFDFDSSELTPSERDDLDGVAKALKDDPDLSLRLDGHTDSIGTSQYNDSLSLQRANAVLDYLRGKGVNMDRLQAQGYGKDNPAESNTSPEGRAKNRRVELEIIE